MQAQISFGGVIEVRAFWNTRVASLVGGDSEEVKDSLLVRSGYRELVEF
jgi:hypothetical protein